MVRFVAALLSLTLAATLSAQTPAAAERASATSKVVFETPASSRPLRVALYDGPGNGGQGVENVKKCLKKMPGSKVTLLKPDEITPAVLANFDVVVFSGGSGGGQAKAIGESGRAAVKQFVESGGGYVGICAGAYLACAGFNWGIGILDARTVSPKWRRGRGEVEIQLSAEGKSVFGTIEDPFTVRYANGPIIKPLGRADIPDYTVLAWYRSELAENDTPEGVMVDSPAVVGATFGRGRVVTISPHPEATPGLENFLSYAFRWVAQEKSGQ